MKNKSLLIAGLLFISASPLMAQTEAQETPMTAAMAAPLADTATAKPALTISGYVDSYYQYNLNRPNSGTNTGRIFDTPHNTFSLGLVQAVFNYTAKKVNVVADLTFGPNADLGNFGNSGTAQIIKQAYIAYDFTDRLTFTVGQFGTHIGYELIDAPLNTNYSLSYLFGNGPFYHTGAKLDYRLSKSTGLTLGVVNGWDALQDYNDKKSVVAQLSLAPVEGFDVYVNWIGGDEYDTRSSTGNSYFGDDKGSFTSLFDLTTAYQLTDAVKVGVNAAYGSFKSGSAAPEAGNAWSEDASWGGAALYLNYAFNDMVGLGVRGEYFSDPKGVRYFGPVEVSALTLTGDVRLAEGRFLIKPEVRYDRAKDNFFEDKNGNGKKSQATVGAAFIYAF